MVCEVLYDDLHTYSHSQRACLLTDDCLLWMQFCEWLQHDTQRVSSRTKFCGQMEYYWHVRVWWAITTVMSGHRISFMLCGNMSMESTPPRTFGLYYQRYLLWVCWQLNSNFLETLLPRLLQDVPRLWVGGFGFVTVELQHSMGRMSFTGKWIENGGFIAWPLWLLDLTAPNFFLRGHVKHMLNLPSQGCQISRDKNIGSSDIDLRRRTNPVWLAFSAGCTLQRLVT
jgi:hypothetical protein